VGQTVIRSPYPPDVAAANLYLLEKRPPQPAETRYLGKMRHLLLIHANEVHAEQHAPGHYRFGIQFELQHQLQMVVSYNGLKLLGTIVATDDGSQLTLRRIDFLGRGIWSFAIFGRISMIALVLFTIHYQGVSHPWMIALAWIAAIALISYGVGLALAFRKAVRVAAIRLIEEAIGAAEAPVTDWHAYLYPNEHRGQYYEQGE
jgi:hypothetical protein